MLDAPARFPLVGACCVTGNGCFQFTGPIEECFFNGGLDIQPGTCTSSGCVEDIPISATRLCCQQSGGGCSDDVAGTASELVSLATSCALVGLAVVGTCGADGRCDPASEPPVALTTPSTAAPPPPSTTSTTLGGTTTTTLPFPICTNIGGACGSCGNGTCVGPFLSIPIGACVVPGPAGTCSPTPAPCTETQVCLGENECSTCATDRRSGANQP